MIRRFGKYEVEAEIGKGGFGRVYRAWDPSVGRKVAIKVITSQGDASLASRFRAEAMAAGSLHHKNIVTIHEFGEYEGEQFLVMEYLDGTDLQQLIHQKAPFSLLEKNNMMIQVGQGLQCAHEHGVVHRDVKPANIMRLTDGSIKIMDFGIARVMRDAETRLTQTGYLIGTVPYMAPEQFRSGEITSLCDIWAYGVVYYEFITGIHPFQAPNPATLMKRITLDELEPIANLIPEFPPELEAVIGRLLAKNREDRYQSFEDYLFDALEITRNLARAELPSLIDQAGKLIESDQHDAAQSLIRRILELDPANKQVRQWREDLREQARRRAVRPRIDELIRQAEEDVEKRKYSSALEKIDSALRLDPVNTTLRNRLDQLRENAEKVKRAERLVVEAKKELQDMDVTGAFEHLQEALIHDPKNTQAARLLQTVNTAIADREAKAKFKRQMSKAKGLIVMQAYDQAISILKELEQEAPGNQEIAAQLEEANRLKREQEIEHRYNLAIGECKELSKQGQYDRAVELLNHLIKQFPSKSDIARPIRDYALEQVQAQREAAELEQIAAEVSAECDAHNFTGARRRVEEALGRYPDTDKLLQLRQSVLRAERAAAEKKELERAKVDAQTATTLFRPENEAPRPADPVPSPIFPASAGAVEHTQQPVEHHAEQPAEHPTERARGWFSPVRLAVAGGAMLVVLAGAWGVVRINQQPAKQTVAPQSQISANQQPPPEAPKTPPSTPPPVVPAEPIARPDDSAAAALKVEQEQLNKAKRDARKAPVPPATPDRKIAKNVLPKPGTSAPAAVHPSAAGDAAQHVAPPAAQAPASKSAAPPPEPDLPAGEYHGPPALRYSWLGDFAPGQTLAIRSSVPSLGSLKGEPLPRFAGSVRVDTQGVSVAQQPSSANGFQLVIRNTGPDTIRSLRFTWMEGKHTSP